MSKKIRLAINGFGRIGRAAFKAAWQKKDIEIVAINDLGDIKTMAHLLKYDSVYGQWQEDVRCRRNSLVIGRREINIYSEKDPINLPWKKLKIDVVLESTGVFRDRASAERHLEAGAKRVIISAPPKDPSIPTYVLGVNEKKINPSSDLIISNASCTTNCLAPVVKVLDDNFGIQYGFMTTIHAYTNDQRILDLPHKDLRRARAAGINIIPTTTGAAKSVVEVIPHLKGRLDGLSIRVPVPVVSVVDFVCTVKKRATITSINQAFKRASRGRLKGILGVTQEPLVSSDFKGDSRSAIVDLALTNVEKNLVKVIAWYDNEWGYSCRYIEMAEYLGQKI